MNSPETTLPTPVVNLEDIEVAAARLRASKLGHYASHQKDNRDNFTPRGIETVFPMAAKAQIGSAALLHFKAATSPEFALPDNES